MKVVSKGGRLLTGLVQAGEVRIPLKSLASRLGLLLLVFIPVLVIAFQGARIALAAHFAARHDAAGLRDAIRLDPGNAGYDDQLGLVCAYSLDQSSLAEAVRYLRNSTALNPRKAIYWSDLAEVCDSINDTTCSDRAVQRALRLSPTTPRLEWRAGNHYLQTGRTDEAFRCFCRLLALDGAYAQPVFEISLRVAGSPYTVLQKVVPPGGPFRLKLAFLDFISAQGDMDFANQFWGGISSRRFECRFAEVKPYLSCLFTSGNIRQAVAVWHTLEKAGVIPESADATEGNLVYNGQFSHAPLRAGFGWHAPDTPDVETDFQDPSFYHGSRCLRVDYVAGHNRESTPVYQLVPVASGQSYRLQAEVRSQGISSASGPRLRVTDVNCPDCLNALTPSTVGTTPWHKVSLDFIAGPKTRLVRLSVWRPRSWSFPMEISGSFWLDNVSITVLHPAPKGAVSTN